MTTSATTLRELLPSDHADWLDLWQGYLGFYATTLPAEATAATWRRLLDPAVPMFARVAEHAGRAIGFAIVVLHEGTWVQAPVAYLEDLYVDPQHRGRGVGRALIDDLLALGRQRGWATLYWHTRADNPARRLYDAFTSADDFVRYRIRL